MRVNSVRRSAAGLAALGLAASAGFLIFNASEAAQAATKRPALKLEAATKTVTASSYDGMAALELGIYAVAGNKPLEIRSFRNDYSQPIKAWQVKAGADAPLPSTAVTNFSAGLSKFYSLKVVDANNKTVLKKALDFCPNSYQPVRRRPDAPATSPYPDSCQANPYTTGSVWGIQQGYGTPAVEYTEAKLKPGKYTATLSIQPAYRDFFNVPAADATAKVSVKVVKGEDDEGEHLALRTRNDQRSSDLVPVKPVGKALKKPKGPLPDLRSLPAWGIVVEDGRYLNFSATVWNAGPSPLVVDGFRQSKNQDLMDAYQYFFDSAGKQVGFAPVGTMEWDKRDGHNHWHFTDFASYRLLDEDKKLVVRSQKEAFCLANTDAIDYTLKGANWHPENTDLHTACGSETSLGVREVLEAGSGDTYVQSLPGQSFDLKGLKNGVYYIEVRANPDKKLAEGSSTNNVAYRKVRVSGTAGHRTVKVAKVGLVDESAYDEGAGEEGGPGEEH